MKLYLLDKSGIEGYKKKSTEIKGLRLCTLLSRDLLCDGAEKCINNIVKVYKEKGLTNSKMVFAFNNDFNKAVFTEKELESLNYLTNYFKKKRVRIGVYDNIGFHGYDRVKNACEIIKNETSELLSHKYSPLEKLMHAYCVVANRKAQLEIRWKEYLAESRSVYAILNSDKICCAGYANHLQAIITQIKDENLKCFENEFGFVTHPYGPSDDVELSGHKTNIVYLNDEKYGIKGYFHLDPTWDYKRGKLKTYGLAYFMHNISDINKVYPKSVRDIDYTEVLEKRFFDIEGIEPNPNWPNFLLNAYWPRSCSLTLDGTQLKLQDKKDKMHQESLGDYLLTRQDFKDFLVLEQTARDIKNNKGNFNTCLINNYKIAENDATKLNVFKSKRTVSKYMTKNSSKVEMKDIIDSLAVVLKNIDKDLTKDERSKHMYNILKNSIKWSEKFKKGAESDFAQSDNLK